jgi:integrase
MDRYDPRDVGDRSDSWDRNFGSRGGTSERDRNDDRESREVFTRDLDLPRGPERRPVRERDRIYEINGVESRTLGAVGAFRIVSETDLYDVRNESQEARRALRYLEREGLIRTSALSSDDRAVVLTERGRDLLEANRYERHDRAHEPRQTFYACQCRCPKGRLRYVPLTQRLTAGLQAARHLRGPLVFCDGDGKPVSENIIGNHVDHSARMAKLKHRGVHVLRHTFCSHLAMRGAPARAIQELAGHADLRTTQRYMHLSPAALDAAIRLLEPRSVPVSFGDMMETATEPQTKSSR